jgi:acyl-CoA synthetase (AMP-forming)/AMP-acid ligase II
MTIKPVYEYDHLCSDALAKNARIYSDNTAVVCGEHRLSWRELDQRTNQIANQLIESGFTKGSKICMLMPNSIHSFLVFWGVIKSGCIIVPLNVMLDTQTLARLIDASDAEMIFTDSSTVNAVEAIRASLNKIPDNNYYCFESTPEGWQPAEDFCTRGRAHAPNVKIHPEDSMTIIYTSGTTGTPKGIEHTHFGRLNYCYGFAPGLGITRYSTAICATPIYASGTWITMLPTLYYGGKVVLLEKFTPQAFYDAMEQERGTHTFMVPAQYISLLEHASDHDTSSLQVLVSAGQSLATDTRQGLKKRFPYTGHYEVYGMTEGFFTIAMPGDYEMGKTTTVGKAGLLEDIRIIDENDNETPTGDTGEIVAYGPGMMKGYYNRDDLTSETVWTSPEGKTFLRSGDLGKIDEDGFLYISGRKKDMIKSGGINIYATDIEDVLMDHPEVMEVAVVGVPHPKWSETPIAVIVAKEHSRIDPTEIQHDINQKLAKYQRLSQVFVVEDLPRATYGKIQKDKLRQQYNDLFMG